MENPSTSKLRIGDWRVDPAAGTIAQGENTLRLDVRSMRLLQCLADQAGQVVSIDDLINHVWAGVAVSSDSVYQAVTSLRRLLGDDPRRPAYIETVPRLGYRMIAPVTVWEEPLAPSANASLAATDEKPEPSVSKRASSLLWLTVALSVAVALGFLLHARFTGSDRAGSAAAAPPQQSVGVLPFLDLTEGMHNEEFADGMTEELIDKLSKIQGLSVPSATSSFYYKGKELPVGQIGRELNVTYLLDGSVRKSGGRVRIATRLMRAENSYVIWTETYDRPLSDLIRVQDDIAGEVAKALKSIAAPPSQGKSF
ncbi:MAG TPA: winged helix-turn-helix domain-containing protein [Terracidiphilus sp.]|nr:winged helix-turn-helix domain-containing protein [Terracidiphilus sp.]